MRVFGLQRMRALHRTFLALMVAFYWSGVAAQVVTEFSSGISAGASPFDITAGPDGNLWFTEPHPANRHGRITPTGVVTEFSTGISAGAQPLSITPGPDGNLWFTESMQNQIGRITPSGVVTEFSTGLTPLCEPIGIVAGPDGNLWFTEYTQDKIGRITPAGVITEFSAGITHGAAPFGIALGPDNNIWFVEPGANQIGMIVVIPQNAPNLAAASLPLRVFTASPPVPTEICGLPSRRWTGSAASLRPESSPSSIRA